jgi:hypothetical protein
MRVTVLRLMKARSAMTAIVTFRRRRAMDMSPPSFLRSFVTTNGSADWAREFFMMHHKACVILDSALFIVQTY